MKKLLLIFLVTGYCLSILAGIPDGCWVISSDGKMNGKKVTVSGSKLKLILDDGKKVVMPLDQIDAYSINGCVFQKLPIYVDGQPTGKRIFMELVKSQGALKLYKYCNWSYPNKKITCFLLYNNDALLMEYDENSCH